MASEWLGPGTYFILNRSSTTGYEARHMAVGDASHYSHVVLCLLHPLSNCPAMQDESPAVSSSRPWTAETTQTALPTPTSPLTHAIFLSTLIIPFAVLPYLAITRHLRGLQATATEVQATTAAMQRELRTTLLENAIRKDEQAHLRRSVEATGAELRELRVRLEKARLAQAAGESTVTVLERRMLQEREWRR